MQVKSLIKILELLPPEADVIAYEGEVIGVVVTEEEKRGVIFTDPDSDGEDEEPEYHELKDFIPS